ncbi:hypothetical protein [Bacillus velezensis]|uniref:hypothetical protein n=1 Tax=Bacillus velezensis TaxID=492670 RepID=UPI0013184C01|nr:hypothetical protein [Bacillus velezensis]QHC13016.1 hypothetical protein GRT15_15375 [Bacillus velezensis]WBS12262.1 hypothetical protein PAN99_15530 [Bacillus velezensis]
MTNDQMRDKVKHMISAGYEDGGIAEYDECNNMLQDFFENELIDLLPKKALQCIIEKFEEIHESGPWDGCLLTGNY